MCPFIHLYLRREFYKRIIATKGVDAVTAFDTYFPTAFYNVSVTLHSFQRNKSSNLNASLLTLLIWLSKKPI